MNIHEYQAKEILKSHGIAVPISRLAKTPGQVEKIVARFGIPCVVKAQIYAGGRGKAGGVKLVHDPVAAREMAKGIYGKRLATYQTAAQGLMVKRFLVEEAISVERELYLSITLDRQTSRYCLIASEEGGANIENLARKFPEKIYKLPLDPIVGVRSYHARQIALFLGLKGKHIDDCIKLIQNLYKLFLEKDCTLIEINPLAISKAGKLLAMDCKMIFDVNALFRHWEYYEIQDDSQLDPLEISAKKYDLAYIKLTGNIGCMVNGAGLAMATLDVLKEFGGEPANFLDVGGGASREKVAEAFRMILADQDVKGIFVNIFGGIMRCDIVAQGIIDATGKMTLCHLPIVVKMDGRFFEEGKRLLSESGLKVEIVTEMAQGAQRVIQWMQECNLTSKN
jgi:succinyl-CoA synthetase beta subunit